MVAAKVTFLEETSAYNLHWNWVRVTAGGTIDGSPSDANSIYVVVVFFTWTGFQKWDTTRCPEWHMGRRDEAPKR